MKSFLFFCSRPSLTLTCLAKGGASLYPKMVRARSGVIPNPRPTVAAKRWRRGGEWLAVAPLRSLPKPGEKRGRGLEGILEFSYATIIIARRENGKEKDKKGGQSALEEGT